MPYPNQHSLRLQDPGKFDEFRTTAGGKLFNKVDVPKTISIIWGHLKGEDKGTFVPQALRFPIKSWTEEKAKAWIKDNEVKGSFEAATEEALSGLFTRYQELKTLSEQAFQSLRDRLYRVVQTKFPDFWLDDWSENAVLLRKREKYDAATHMVAVSQDPPNIYHQVKYVIDSDGEIVFDGEPKKVRQVINYVPIEEPAGGK
jgi:hypothetical protein